MPHNSVRQKLKDGRTAYGVMAAEFFTPGFCRIASNAGVDFIIFDMEHGGVGIDVLKAQIGFARGAGVTPIVRVPGIAYHLVARSWTPAQWASWRRWSRRPSRLRISRNGAGTARKACEA